jgi:hypothetical protein
MLFHELTDYISRKRLLKFRDFNNLTCIKLPIQITVNSAVNAKTYTVNFDAGYTL